MATDTNTRDSLADLDRYRTQLEETLKTLQQDLRKWQLWEIEYEGLKEQVDNLSLQVNRESLENVKSSFERELLTEKEVDDILGFTKSETRTKEQISNQITRRVDYVQRNIEHFQKQVNSIQTKLEKIEVLSAPDLATDDGLPITEIHEELDEEGNVVSSNVSHPGQSSQTLLDALKKVGLSESEIRNGAPNSKTDEDFSDPIKATSPQSDDETSVKTRSRNKSVSFAEDTKPGDNDAAPQTAESHSLQIPELPDPNASSTTKLAQGSFGPHDRVLEIDDEDNIVGVNDYVMPEGESEEDAALRRELIQYSLSENGAIVAELNLEEETSDYDWSDEEDDIDLSEEGSASSAMGDEDEHGLSRRSNISDKYREEMMALEQRLQASIMQNLGPEGDAEEAMESIANDSRRLVVMPEGDPGKSKFESGTEKKSVRFADSLDIAPSTKAPSMEVKCEPTLPQESEEPPMKSTILERNSSASTVTPTAAPDKKKASRFKSQRKEVPTGPANATLAQTVVERPSSRSAASPRKPNELNSEVHNQQVVNEYYQQRNKMIQQQGGFTRQKEDLEDLQESGVGDDLEPDQPKKKVSLFKAARLGTGSS